MAEGAQGPLTGSGGRMALSGPGRTAAPTRRTHRATAQAMSAATASITNPTWAT